MVNNQLANNANPVIKHTDKRDKSNNSNSSPKNNLLNSPVFIVAAPRLSKTRAFGDFQFTSF